MFFFARQYPTIAAATMNAATITTTTTTTAVEVPCDEDSVKTEADDDGALDGEGGSRPHTDAVSDVMGTTTEYVELHVTSTTTVGPDKPTKELTLG